MIKKWLLIFYLLSSIHLVADNSSRFIAKDFSSLYKMQGFDKNLLSMHFTLYAGYVANTNLMIEQLNDLIKNGKDRSIEYASIKRRFGWEYNGMVLHEWYFQNLGGSGTALKKGNLAFQIDRDFGAFDNWKNDFIATGMMRGIGWSVLCYDHKIKKLMNVWINEHDLGNLVGNEIILVMDVFEHAYITQFGLDRMKYIQLFFDNINWEIVESRFNKGNAGPLSIQPNTKRE
ncbi:MAG: superoxide dismutase [Chlamydiales bacterium]|nr:superoxide dismutase [Chlamydiales bacterium]